MNDVHKKGSIFGHSPSPLGQKPSRLDLPPRDCG